MQILLDFSRWNSTINVTQYRKVYNYETVTGGCVPSKIKFKTQKSRKLRWLASDMNFKLLHIGCPVAHDNDM